MVTINILTDCELHKCNFKEKTFDSICKVYYDDIYKTIFFNINKKIPYKHVKHNIYMYKCLQNHKNTETLTVGEKSVSAIFRPGGLIEYKNKQSISFESIEEYNDYVSNLYKINIKTLPYPIEKSEGYFADNYLKDIYIEFIKNFIMIKNKYGNNSPIYKKSTDLLNLFSDVYNFNNSIMLYN